MCKGLRNYVSGLNGCRKSCTTADPSNAAVPKIGISIDLGLGFGECVAIRFSELSVPGLGGFRVKDFRGFDPKP